MKPSEYQDIKKLLLKKKALLLKADHSFGEEIKNKDQAGRGDEADVAETAYEQEMAYLFKSRGQDEVRLIDEALKRIEKGEYGICAECGETISKKRLAVQPYSILCINCQNELERMESKKDGAHPR